MQVLLVGKDFGARVAYHLALVYPERVVAVTTLGVPFVVITPETFPGDLPKGFYVLRFQATREFLITIPFKLMNPFTLHINFHPYFNEICRSQGELRKTWDDSTLKLW